MLINGIVYLGSVIMYNVIVALLFSSEAGSDGQNVVMTLIYAVTNLLYNFWILVIYIIALTLNTFWVQDIFDELLILQLQKAFKDEKVTKNPVKYLKAMQEADVIVNTEVKEKSVALI